MTRKKPPEKYTPLGVGGRVRVRLETGLGLGSGGVFRGDLFLEPLFHIQKDCSFKYFESSDVIVVKKKSLLKSY